MSEGAAAGAPALPNMADIAGPYVVGHLLSFAFFGVLCVQIYLYHLAFHRSDPLWLKNLVYSILGIELAIQSLEMNLAWWSLGAGWGNPVHIFSHSIPANTLPLLTGIITSIVHGFYIWRIFGLGKRYEAPLVIALLSAVQLSMTAYMTAHLFQHAEEETLSAISTTERIVTIWLTFAATADIIISVAMVVLLFQTSKRTVFEETSTKLQKIMKYTVQTAVITSCWAGVELILFLALPKTNWYSLMFLSLSKIYANTLLATLNSRFNLVTASSQLQNSGNVFRSGLLRNTDTTSRSSQSGGKTIHVSTTKVVFSDTDADTTDADLMVMEMGPPKLDLNVGSRRQKGYDGLKIPTSSV